MDIHTFVINISKKMKSIIGGHDYHVLKSTVKRCLSEIIGTRGGLDKRFFWIIEEIQSYYKTAYAHTVVYCTVHYEQQSNHSFFCLKFVLFVVAKFLILFRSRSCVEQH